MFEGFYGAAEFRAEYEIRKHVERLVTKRQQSRETQRRITKTRRRRRSNTATLDPKHRQIKRMGDGLVVRDHMASYYEPYNNDDKPATIRSRPFFPEDTYEHWHLEKELNKNVQRLVDVEATREKKRKHEGDQNSSALVFSSSEDEDDNSDKDLEQEQQEDDDDDDDDEEEDEQENARTITDKVINDRVKQKKPYIDKVSTQVLLEKSGYEILPYTPQKTAHIERSTALLRKPVSYTDGHYQMLHNMLYMCVLRRKWELGYKVFSTLIRLPRVDIRGIWPQGLEILTRLAEKKILEDNPDASEYTLKTFSTATESGLRLVKDEEFLQWVITFYPITLARYKMRSSIPFPYRKGSKLTPPMFVITLIWTLLYKQKFELVNERLADILLMNPYINDGVFHFVQGLSFQMEAAFLVQKEIFDKHKVQRLISDAEKFYQQANALGAVFPEKLMKVELDLIRSNMDEPVHSASDDDTMNDQSNMSGLIVKNEARDESGFNGVDQEDGARFDRLKDINRQNGEDDYDSDD